MAEYYLYQKRTYLSGPIQYDTSEVNWRLDVIQQLQMRFGLNIFDPFSDPKQKNTPILENARKFKDYSKIAEIAKTFVRKDLAMVDRADIVIAFLPHKVPTVGTHHEVINSNNAKKPTLLVTNTNDISDIPMWYFGFIPKEFMFPNWDKLYEYLESVNKGEQRSNNRWSYIYGDI